jgi:RNA 2',3'-cyclic 3'-phosphodiesterase
VSSPGSVGGDERLRLFLGLQLPDAVVASLAVWQERELRGRIVPPDNLHITLAFLGSRPSGELQPICGVLSEAAAAVALPVFELVRYRETRSVGMLVLDDAGNAAGELAGDLHARLEELGVYERERRDWLPHVTVLRFRERPKLRPPLPDLGPFSPSDAAVYHSVLRSSGAQYVVVESFALGG